MVFFTSCDIHTAWIYSFYTIGYANLLIQQLSRVVILIKDKIWKTEIDIIIIIL